jgi:exosortase D (VPLPA-CTERM-specific)
MSKIFRENAINFAGINSKYWGWTFLLLVSFLFCFAKVFAALVTVWWNNDVYSHGFLVPLISLYLIWIKRDKLKSIPLSPNSKAGFSILLCGLSMLLMGHLGGVNLIQEYSIIISIVGIILIIFGIKYLQALFFPIMYLFFMIPFARIFTDGFHYPFQLLSAKIAIAILNLIGIPSIRIANNIELPNITLEVAKGCSGVNYLISIIAIAIPLTYLTQKYWSRRVILIFGAVIVAILSNGLRVALIGILSYHGLNASLHGPYHILQAMFVYIFGLSFLFIGAWILSDGKSGFTDSSTSKAAISSSPTSKTNWHTPTIRNSLFITTMIFLIVGIYINLYTPSPISMKRNLKYFPYEIGKWKGNDSKLDYDTFRSLGVDYDISRTYSSPDGKEINLYIGYYMYQEQGKELLNYKSEWLYDNASKYTIILNSNDAIRVNRVIKKDSYKNRLIVYWYNLNGRIITDKLEVKMYTTFDAIFKHRTNGTFIMITLDLLNYVDINEALRYSEMFLKDTFPIIKDFII